MVLTPIITRTVVPSITLANAKLVKVPTLDDENYDDWYDELRANLRSQGLEHFLDSRRPKLLPGQAGFAMWDHKRQLAKAIVKISTIRIARAMRDRGWNPKSKNPKSHFQHAVGVMTERARASGKMGRLIYETTHIKQADHETLAAYQGKLQRLRRKLAHLGHPLDEETWLWIAINGLRKKHRHWYHALEHDMRTGNMTWSKLMQDMWSRALKEHTREPDEEHSVIV